ncbi:MAG: HAD family hydrolase [Hyphomicrobiales bacterium]
MTRLIRDPAISDDYARPFEEIGDGVNIIRIEAGPDAYLRKEDLWDHLDSFSDAAAIYLQEAAGRMPDVIHSHYADAGYVGTRLSNRFGVPLIHTGHSLGRVKRLRLLASGVSHDEIEARYAMARRVDAEEATLATAELVIASTHNEVEEQYGLYDCYHPAHMAVVPPGTDLTRFHAPDARPIREERTGGTARFLSDPAKPMILAIARADERKNLGALVVAYGENRALQERANLVIAAGTRDDIRQMDEGASNVLTELLHLIDTYDLYGKVAYPKQVTSVPDLYRLASTTGGVFVNPALTEPFGLTILEAAASGLPIVATNDGGPTDILANCENGVLVDPLDTVAIGKAIAAILEQPATYKRMRENGLAGVARHYSWEAHAEGYMQRIAPIVGAAAAPRPAIRRAKVYRDRAIFSDIDQSLIGDAAGLADLSRVLAEHRKSTAFGITTGRPLDSALRAIRAHAIPMPDILVTATGTAIHYAPELIADGWWARHIDHHWEPKAIRRLLDELAGLNPQPKEFQSRYKISYYIDPQRAPCLEDVQALIYQSELNVNMVLSFGQYLDITPARASKGQALRYAVDQLGIPLDHVLVAGGSGADEDMMRGNARAVVVANRHDEELSGLVDTSHIFFATRKHAGGIVEAIDHYDFFDL